jgi:hypothetical protein
MENVRTVISLRIYVVFLPELLFVLSLACSTGVMQLCTSC